MNIRLKCSCGAVAGVAVNITPDTGNRAVCCCDDCQAFAKHLGRDDDILDEFGGTDIYQTSQSQVAIDTGAEYLRCVRLTSKGLLRWYADCCKTPIGNTISAGMPLIGLIHNFMHIEGDRGSVLGPVRAFVQTKHAHGKPTYPHSAEKFPLGIALRIIGKMLLWKLRGMHRPSAFFDEHGNPVVKATVLN